MKLLAALVVVVGLAGCETIDTPTEKLAALTVGFTSAVRELERYCDDGFIELEKCQDAVPAVLAGQSALHAARVINRGGGDISTEISALRAALRSLPQYGGQ